MRAFVSTSLLFGALMMSGCAIDAREGGENVSTSAEIGALTSAEAYGGLTYGGGGTAMVRWRSRGSVKSCTAGPRGVLLPNRFVDCECDQVVKDCGQDLTCGTCSNVRSLSCASSTWFSSLSYLFGDCNVSELNSCEQFCRDSCGATCENEWIPNK